MPRRGDMNDATQMVVVTATNRRPTETGVRDGVDLDVRIDLRDGTVLDGEVTLVPADINPGYGIWGSVENWLDGRTVAALSALRDGELCAVLDAIEQAAVDAAGEVSS
jgi:hypothetical protein